MTRNVRRLTVSAVTLLVFAAMAAGADANHSTMEHISVGPTGGNGVADVFFDATSSNGSRAFFDTDEKLVGVDTDASFDLYERHGGTTTLLSTGPSGGNGAFDVFFAAASADGTRAFFETDERLTSDDMDSSFDVYERTGSTTTLISTGAEGGNGLPDVTFHAISADGSHVFFETEEVLEDTDMDLEADVYERSGGTTKQVSIGPTGGNGSFFVAFGGVSEDGTRAFFETDEKLTGTDMDSFFDVYERSGGSTTLISTGPSGGNGNFDAGYRDISANGSHVFFHTIESLTGTDADAPTPQTDVYDRSGGNTTLISTGPEGGNGAVPASFEGRSGDGTRVFFSTTEPLTSGDDDGRRDIYMREGTTTQHVSSGPGSDDGAFDADFMGASVNGARAYIRTEEPLLTTDTDTGCAAGQGPQCRDIYEYAGGTTTQVSTGSINGNGAFDASFAAVSLDGQRVFFDTREPLETGDGDASVDVYERFGGATTLISTVPGGANGTFTAFLFPNGLSDDGTRAFFDTRESLMTSDTDTSFDIYAANVYGYARPLSASPLKASLVPAQVQCTAPNRTHGAPLAHPSCGPPAATSGQATMGTSDANGAAPLFVGSVRYSVVVGNPGPPEGSDVTITSSLVDVRCRPPSSNCGGSNAAGPADYTGELRTTVDVRMTDRFNGTGPGGGTDPATGQEVSLGRSFLCAPTTSTARGSSCTLNTSANAIVPGLVKETQRAIWQMGQIKVFDGGPDGDADTSAGNTLFAVQGVFIP